jgi:arylsulfatase A-like enzyme
VPPGWTQWAAFVHADYYDYALSVDGEISRHGAEPHDYSTDVLVERALAFLDRADDPVFLVLAVAAPHDPAIPAPRHRGTPTPDWTPPPSFDEPDVADKPAWLRRLPRLGEAGRRAVDSFRRQQIRSLQAVDEAVGSLIERQRARGRLRETVFVYTSDNGLSWGEHRWTKKEVPYDESIRVPLVIRADGLVEPHAEDRIALNIDLAPTIADLAGVPAPDTDGRTLRPLLTDRETEWRSAFLVEHLMGANPVPTYCAVRTRTHLYVRYETGERELFDLRVDPYQLVNAVDSEPSVVERLDHRLTVMCDPPPPRLAGSEGTRATDDGPDRAAGGEDMLPIVMVAALALGAGAVWVFGRRPLKSDRGSGRS